MELILTFCIVFATVVFFSEQIRTRAILIYILTTVAAIYGFLYSVGDGIVPSFGSFEIIERLIVKGLLATTLFIIVMITAVLKKGTTYTKKLYTIRGELSIIASILIISHILGHSVTYGKFFLDFLAENTIGELFKELLLPILVYIDSILSLILVIPLFITSFKKIRKKMEPKKWKSLQRWSYLLYFLIYLHVVLLYGLYLKKYTDFMIYTVIFAYYLFKKLSLKTKAVRI